MSLNLFDSYNLRARTSVALFYTLPFILDVIALFGKSITSVGGVALFVLILVTVHILHLCRSNHQSFNRNYAAEYLMPDSEISNITKNRYYRKIASFEPEFIAFGNIDEENTQEAISINLCESVVTWLRAKTRDNKVFHLVYEENINYGFIWNMFNLKKVGIIFNCIALAFLALIFFTPIFENDKPTHFVLALEIAAHFTATMYLIAAVTKKKDETSAKRYAKALIEAIDLIG